MTKKADKLAFNRCEMEGGEIIACQLIEVRHCAGFETRRARLWRAVDLDDVAVGIEDEELRKTGGSVAADHDTHRVVLRGRIREILQDSRGAEKRSVRRRDLASSRSKARDVRGVDSETGARRRIGASGGDFQRKSNGASALSMTLCSFR